MHRLLIALLLITASPAAGQTVTAATGAMNGRVTDSTKAILPGVTVTLSGPAIMSTQTAVTDEHGTFRFAALPLGDSKVTFELAGFRTEHEGIKIGVGFTAT